MATIYSISSGDAASGSAGQSTTTGASINDAFVRCLDLYRSLTFQLLEKGNSDVGGGVDLNRLTDEFGRLRIWGEQTKASLPPRARASLDDFLRSEGKLSKEVEQILAQLRTLLSLAISATEESEEQITALDGNTSDSMVSDSDYSTDSRSEDCVDPSVQLLYHLASLLRRPGLKGRYLRHTNTVNVDAATFFDIRHIGEKLRQWSRPARETSVISEKDEAVSVKEISERERNQSTKSLHYVLCRRLANANAQRREQLKFWTKNPCQMYRLQETSVDNSGAKALKSAIQKRPKKDNASTEDDRSTMKPQSKGLKSEKSRSTTVFTFSTVAESALLESGTETGKPQTIYAESVVARQWSARVPPPPKQLEAVDGPEQYECPYCHMNLSLGLMHRRTWTCHECNFGLEEKQELVQHLRDNHSGNWTDRQLSIILEMSERPMEESIILPCSLCTSELSLNKLLDHIAEHLEELSLFALPVNSELDDNNNSNRVIGVDSCESGEKKAPSQLDSLQFSDIPQSDREAMEGESSIPYVQSPTASLVVGTASGHLPDDDLASSTSVSSLDMIVDKVVKHAYLLQTLNPASIRSLQPALSIWEIKSLCEKAKEILLSQSALLELEAPMVVCGDVQGQFTNLLQCFDIGGFPPAANYLFMGNYVGETPDIKTICLLFSYKIKYPENFFLLRGSQELQEIPRRSPDYDNIEKWNAITDVFNCLPFAAIIDDKIFVVHGGLSPDLTSMEQIRGIVRPIHSLSDDHLLSHLLSTNPNNKITGWSKDTLGSWQFGPDVVSRFLQKHNLDLICRSHERVIGGYEFFAERQLVTVYSASNEDYIISPTRRTRDADDPERSRIEKPGPENPTPGNADSTNRESGSRVKANPWQDAWKAYPPPPRRHNDRGPARPFFDTRRFERPRTWRLQIQIAQSRNGFDSRCQTDVQLIPLVTVSYSD
ncbi:hypothetical protein NPX13_g20 [Xylaria arbuscula]|uniref:protein-serine/threonine phosphatase n=1 Tax=Xylaria arbuscula TaxID=114810 RepID=A0A9W8TSM4_9PEZI|nr:hypothetical protein NPX13_g20 [Xylaria arbuscula]